MITINTIRLLDKQEYEDFRSVVPEMGKKWLLSSTSIVRGHVLAVEEDGLVCSVPVAVSCGVRPAALLTIEEHDFHSMDKITFLGLTWTIFSVCDEDLWVLCDELIAFKPFNLSPGKRNNDWETSTLKEWLEEWVEYTVMGLDDVVYDPLSTERFLRETRKSDTWGGVLEDHEEKEDLPWKYEEDVEKVLPFLSKSHTLKWEPASSIDHDDIVKRWAIGKDEMVAKELKKLLKK